MSMNFETTFDAIRAEQRVAHLHSNKLGPLLADVERQPVQSRSAVMNSAGVRPSTIVEWLRHKLSESALKWSPQVLELRPSVERQGSK